MKDASPKFMTSSEVSAKYKIPLRTLLRLYKKGCGPRYHRIGNTPYYLAADIDAFISSCAVDPNKTLAKTGS